jgi:hypothetical protein
LAVAMTGGSVEELEELDVKLSAGALAGAMTGGSVGGLEELDVSVKNRVACSLLWLV